MITVGQLRKLLAENKDLHDDAPVLVRPHDGAEFSKEPWRYNTRELENAYHANDDRYEHSGMILLELGDMSP